MNVLATPHSASASPKPAEHFDVLIVGAGISGIGSAYQLTKQLPDKSFVILESQESFGGTWLDPQISGHPLRQRSSHLRLQLQAMGRAADRELGGNQDLYGRGDRGERSRKAHPLQAQDRTGELVEHDQSVDGRGGADRQRRADDLHCEFPLDVPGLLSPFAGLHAAMDRHGQVQGPHRPSAASGRRISSLRARKSW